MAMAQNPIPDSTIDIDGNTAWYVICQAYTNVHSGYDVNGEAPPIGNQFHLKAKMNMSAIPNKKYGTADNTNSGGNRKWTKRCTPGQPRSAPARLPKRNARKVDTPTRPRVQGSDCQINVITLVG